MNSFLSCAKKFVIDRVNFRGEGLAYGEDHKIYRIANALEGETVLAVEASLERRRQAYLQEVVSPSPERIPPQCPHWRRCAMCQLSCMAYASQIAQKEKQWRRLLEKFLDLSKISNEIIFKRALYEYGYRNRCEGTVFGDVIGMMPRSDACVAEMSQSDDQESISPIPLSSCALHRPELNALIQRVEAVLPKCGFPKGTRLSFEANDAVLGARFQAESMSSSRVIVYGSYEERERARSAAACLGRALEASVVFQELPPHGSHVYPPAESISGNAWYAYDSDGAGNVLCALKGAWTPVNPLHAHQIRQTLEEMVANCLFEHCLEIGCGCGTHTDVLTRRSTRYTGIDASWNAIQSAQFNASNAEKWQNVAFYTDTAEHYLDKRYYKGIRADGILLHSNRMPYSRKTAELCLRFGANTIFIVAPTAYALAQECRHFCDLGLTLESLVLCDTLPMSYHMMGVAKLRKRPEELG